MLRKGSPMKTVDDIIFSDITNVISDLELGCGGAVVVSRLLILQNDITFNKKLVLHKV